MRVGFAGLGRMGIHMARNLEAAGHDLTLWNRSVKKAEDLAQELACDSAPTQAAKNGALMIMAGCSEDAAQPLMPIFNAMAKKTVCLGRLGNGAVMKLAVNSLIHGINQTLSEAMTLAEASGIEPVRAFDVIEASAACAPMLKYRRPLYLDESAHDVTFTIALAEKDMAVTAALAERLGVAMPQGRVTLEKLSEARAAGYADRDMAAMLNFMREENE